MNTASATVGVLARLDAPHLQVAPFRPSTPISSKSAINNLSTI
jgi:hypothetical protein